MPAPGKCTTRTQQASATFDDWSAFLRWQEWRIGQSLPFCPHTGQRGHGWEASLSIEAYRRLGARYQGCRLTNFEATYDAQRDVLDKLRVFAANLGVSEQGQRGLLLYGPVGTGKDHLLVGTLRVASLVHHWTFAWWNGLDLFALVRDRMDQHKPEAELVDMLAYPDVLALSDPVPPTGTARQFNVDLLFRVIDRRYRESKPTWVTINVAGKDEAEAKLSAPILDRFRHGALRCSAIGKAIERGQNREPLADRLDRIRACGNGVVAIQAAYAFVWLFAAIWGGMMAIRRYDAESQGSFGWHTSSRRA